MNSELETNASVPGENPILPNHKEEARSHAPEIASAAKKDERTAIERLFESYHAAKAQTQAEAAAIHSKEWSNYESHSALMQKNAAYAPDSSSLTDKVRNVLGRR